MRIAHTITPAEPITDFNQWINHIKNKVDGFHRINHYRKVQATPNQPTTIEDVRNRRATHFKNTFKES